jgi:MFS family permease
MNEHSIANGSVVPGPDGIGFKTYASQFLYGAAAFSAILFIPNYASHALKATDLQVGLIVFAYAACGFFSSIIFGRLADVRGRRIVLAFGFALASVASLLQVLPSDPWTLLASRALTGTAAGMIPAALLAVAWETRRRMGRFAAMGSLGWGIGAILAGIVTSIPSSESAGVRAAFGLSAFFFAAAFFVVLGMKLPPHTSIPLPLFPVEVVRRNLSVYLTLLLRHIGANMIWVIFPVYLEDALGLSKGQIGVIYLVNTFVQFVVMGLLDPLRGESLLLAGLGFSAVTFYSFTLARNFWEMLPTQVLLGISWSCVYVGSLKIVMERNEERATAAGFLGSIINLSQAFGPLLGGLIAFHLGRKAVMLVAAAMALADLLLYGVRALVRRAKPLPSARP